MMLPSAARRTTVVKQAVEPAPVTGDEDDLEVADEPVPLDLLLVAGAVLGIGVHGEDVPAEELGMGPGEQLAGRVVGVEDGPVAGDDRHGVVALLEQLAILLRVELAAPLLSLLSAHQRVPGWLETWFEERQLPSKTLLRIPKTLPGSIACFARRSTSMLLGLWMPATNPWRILPMP